MPRYVISLQGGRISTLIEIWSLPARFDVIGSESLETKNKENY